MTDTLAPTPARRSLGRHVGSFRWTPGLIAGIAMFGGIVLCAVIAPIALSDAANSLSNETGLPISSQHWLGTDNFGRDMLARALVASRLTLVMALAATAISVGFGVAIGAAIWVAPRGVRELSLRVLEIAVSYPGLLVALVIAAILSAGALPVVIAVGVSNIPTFARLTANLASSISQREFVATARLLGVPNRLLITKHLLPNMAEPLLILIASNFSVGLMEMSGLSFVGLGVQAPDYDLGKLLSDALPAIYSRPLEVVGSAVMIVLMALSAMLIGDGLAASSDPRSRRDRFTPKTSKIDQVPPAAEQGADDIAEVRDLQVTATNGSVLVKGISFTIRRGEILGVVGESGSGKSLTAMSLAQLLPDGVIAHASSLRVDSLDLRVAAPRSELAAKIALVYQDPGSTFNPALRMSSQLGEVLRVHHRMSAAAAKLRILRALATVRIIDPERLLRAHPYELSGGMRQRAMIASALASDAKLIIADEPTTALDVTVQAEILREFTRINRDLGTSMLFISHDIGVVEALCHRVLVMKDGEVVEELSASDLANGLARHPYTRMLVDATPRLNRTRAVR